MAGRFVFQELASGMSRSTSRLGFKGSASSAATAPVRASEDGTSNVFHGAAIHSGTALPSSSRVIHGRAGGGIGTLSILFHGAAVRPGMVVPSNHEILSGSENGIRTLNNVFHGAAIHPGTALPNSSHGLHGLAGGGIGTLSNLFRGAAVHPGMVVPSKREILSGCAARCLNTATAKTGRSTNRSIIEDRLHEGSQEQADAFLREAGMGPSNIFMPK